MSQRWISNLVASVVDLARSSLGRRRTASRPRPIRLERLEERRLLAITVNTLVDELDGSIVDGDISLRDAIASAAPNETIDFSVTGTIELSSELVVDKDLTINGPGSDRLTIKGYDPTPESNDGAGGRVLLIDDSNLFADKQITLAGLRLAGGDVSGDGGAILNRENLTITACLITDNSAMFGIFGGGAIYNASGVLAIDASTINRNRTQGSGGGIFSDIGDVSVTGSTIRDNTAQIDGGGIHSLAGSVSITASTIAGNMATNGGGVANQGGTFSSINSTISGNAASARGGGLDLATAAMLKHTTVSANHADSDNNFDGQGGGIFAALVVDLDHTIVSGNFVGQPPFTVTPDDLFGPWTESFSLIGGNAGLGPLKYSGSLIATHALLPDSPAIDAGDPAAVPGLNGVPIDDERGSGFTRVSDGDGVGGARIDVGAFELQATEVPLSLVVDTLVDELDEDYSTGDLSLREAIALTNQNHLTADVISFDPSLAGGTIHLELGELFVTDSLTLIGLGASLLTIDATANDLTPLLNNGDGSRIFSVDDGNDEFESVVAISGLTLTGGDPFSGGGAIRNKEDLTVTACTISGNSAVANGGGLLSLDGKLSVVDSIISGNTSHKDYAQYGGGGALASFSYLKLMGTAIFGNASEAHGGGVFSGDGETKIINSTISGNESGTAASNFADGGGVFIGKGSDPAMTRAVTIAHSTITLNNSFGAGRGVFVDPSVVSGPLVDHSIVAGNLGVGTDIVGSVTLSFSLHDLDPQLAPLADNGGSTLTHALLPGSPAIDAGNPLAVASLDGVPLYDQRGAPFVRVFSGSGDAWIDIGAFEAQPAGLLGDYNHNQVVDAADYTIWRNTLGGSTALYAGADGDGNGVVGQGDYGVWKDHFGLSANGQGSASQSTLSEPLDATARESTASVESDVGAAILSPPLTVETPAVGSATLSSAVALRVDAGPQLESVNQTPSIRDANSPKIRSGRETTARASIYFRDLLLATIGRNGYRFDDPVGSDESAVVPEQACPAAAVDSAIAEFSDVRDANFRLVRAAARRL